MTDEQLDFTSIRPEREATPDHAEAEAEYIFNTLVDWFQAYREWYRDPQPVFDAIAEKLGKTAVKKVLESLDPTE